MTFPFTNKVQILFFQLTLQWEEELSGSKLPRQWLPQSAGQEVRVLHKKNPDQHCMINCFFMNPTELIFFLLHAPPLIITPKFLVIIT